VAASYIQGGDTRFCPDALFLDPVDGILGLKQIKVGIILMLQMLQDQLVDYHRFGEQKSSFAPPPQARSAATRSTFAFIPAQFSPAGMRFLMLNWRDPRNPLSGGAERVTLGYLA